MKSALICFTAAAILLFTGCSQKTNPVSDVKERFDYPLKWGNKWTYFQVSIQDSHGIAIKCDTMQRYEEVTDTVRAHGNLYYKVRTSESPGGDYIAGFDAAGNYLSYVDTSTAPVAGVFGFPLYPVLGQTWMDSLVSTSPKGEPLDTIPFARNQIIGKSDISTPLGDYKQCWVVLSYSIDFLIDTSYSYYASGVGLVGFTHASYDTSAGKIFKTTKLLQSIKIE